jgi:hypothetical protein
LPSSVHAPGHTDDATASAPTAARAPSVANSLARAAHAHAEPRLLRHVGECRKTDFRAEAAVVHVDFVHRQRPGDDLAAFGRGIQREFDVVAAFGRLAGVLQIAVVVERGRLRGKAGRQRECEQRAFHGVPRFLARVQTRAGTHARSRGK